jgi:hypothetical protein
VSAERTPGRTTREALRALLDEVFDDIEHVVNGNAGWIDRDMLDRYRSDAADYLAKPHWTERLGPVTACEHVAAHEPEPGSRMVKLDAAVLHREVHRLSGQIEAVRAIAGPYAGEAQVGASSTTVLAQAILDQLDPE